MDDPYKGELDLGFLDQPEVLKAHYKAGEVVFVEGSPATEMFIVQSGTLSISVNGHVVEEIGPGGMFGEMALIGHETRSATVTAVTDAEIVPIDERLFVVLVHQTPFFALSVLRMMAQRLRRLNEQV